eukprot:CAMPEP_0181229298 /NCGR_PEP_ID=MMETSP1096-20121128/33817_1 /TAXON_ID=156174 ORGANISM="Chrysochromulina ericina, Strain CCMP281" /NCGR_SAMPLE_ID=MMETSP1096 /ASSEMBLY_ACC=CAM_ASM_000453 /LENGTH=67 /DNA_ID=CAMNT_0023322901 /DNA_START=606 /DNA_END=806 /DNA_ORIENTATION=+
MAHGGVGWCGGPLTSSVVPPRETLALADRLPFSAGASCHPPEHPPEAMPFCLLPGLLPGLLPCREPG